MRFIDITGQRFGKLVVIGKSNLYRNENNGKTKRVKWECLCDCGNTIFVTSKDLRSGNTKSCGCYRTERTIESSKTHGKSKTKLYKLYLEIKDRCRNPKNKSYPRYGAEE